MYATFRTGKFRPEIAFTVCTDKFHFPKNDREGPKLVLKMLLGNGTRISVKNILSGKTGIQASEMFRFSRTFSARTQDPERRVPLTFQPDFSENFCKW